MAEDYSSQTVFPYIQRFATGSANVLTEINLPPGGRKVTLVFETNAGKLAHTGTDGGALGSADFFHVPANAPLEIVYGMGISADGGALSLFATSATGTTYVGVLLEGQADLEER